MGKIKAGSSKAELPAGYIFSDIYIVCHIENPNDLIAVFAEKFYRFSDYLGTTSQMSELLGISSISGILRFGRYPAYHGISEPHLAVKSSKSVVENRPYY